MSAPGEFSGLDTKAARRLATPEALRARLQYVESVIAGMSERPVGPCLMWRDATGEVRAFSLQPGAVLGRGRNCALQLPDEKLSRQHCRFVYMAAAGWSVEDLRSTNGTLVNGRSVPHIELCDGDVLTLGATDFVFLG